MKIAISLPDELFDEAENYAERKNLTRSALYALAIRAYLDERRDSLVTEQLDVVYDADDGGLNEPFAGEQAKFLRDVDEAW